MHYLLILYLQNTAFLLLCDAGLCVRKLQTVIPSVNYWFFWDYHTITYFLFPLLSSKPSHIKSLTLRKRIIATCICVYTYIPKDNLLSLNNACCVFSALTMCPLPLGSPFLWIHHPLLPAVLCVESGLMGSPTTPHPTPVHFCMSIFAFVPDKFRHPYCWQLTDVSSDMTRRTHNHHFTKPV